MIFKERQKRAMDTMNHRNREYLEKMNGSYPKDDEENLQGSSEPEENNPLAKENLEKGDLPAMVISALITFLPIILVIAIIMLVAVKLLS